MKYVTEFRDPKKAQAILAEIGKLSQLLPIDPAKPLKLMEICGGHTHSIFKYGLETVLPESIELIHGPGCPVCVMPRGRLDDAIALAEQPNVIFTTFGDAMRVPGCEYYQRFNRRLESWLQSPALSRMSSYSYPLKTVSSPTARDFSHSSTPRHFCA